MNNKYKVLGINYGHDSSASIGIDGEIITACEQERYDLKKHSKTYPNAIGYLRVNYESYKYKKKDLLKKLNRNTKNYNKFISSYHCFKKILEVWMKLSQP